MNKTLSPRDRQAFNFIVSEVAAHGIVPAQYKIAIALGLSPSSTDVVRGCFADFVQALQVSPKVGLAHKLRGLTPLSESTKRNWLVGFPTLPSRGVA